MGIGAGYAGLPLHDQGMRSYQSTAAAAAALFVLAHSAVAQGDAAQSKPTVPTVAVLPFDNLDEGRRVAGQGEKGWTLPSDPLAEACRLAIEQMFVQRSGENLKVVERDRLARALQELELHSSPLVDQDSAVRLAKYVGARFLVSGSIQPIEIKEVEVKAYELDMKNVTAKAEVLVKILNVETAQIEFSETFEGVNVIRSNRYRKEDAKERQQVTLPAVKDALKAARGAESLRKYFAKFAPEAKAAGSVMLEVAAEPGGCDVEVDGLFVGNTPCKVEVPLDKVITLKISRSGYESWEKQMKATADLAKRKIAPVLARKETPSQSRQSGDK